MKSATVNVNVKLPQQVATYYEYVSKLSGVPVADVLAVVVAVHTIRHTQNMPKRKAKK